MPRALDPGGPRSAPSGQRGQASLEYAGVLAVVAAVLVLVGVASGGGGILNGVLRGLERALCRVTGDDCSASELAACTVRSRETGGKVQVKLTFVKLGGSLSLLREELSDGSVEVTLLDGTDVAPTAALGVSGGVALGGERKGAGLMAEAELLVRLGRRRTWRRPDAEAADRLVEDIREHLAASAGERVMPFVGPRVRRLAHAIGFDGDVLPRPDVEGISAGLEGAAQAGLGDVASGRLTFKASLGGTRDRRSGKRTLVIGLESEASAALSRAAGGALAHSAGATLVVTYDREGEPLELALAQAGIDGGDGGLDLPRGRGGGRQSVGERIERTTRLDLQRSENRAVYERLVEALSPPGASDLPGATDALSERLRTGARVDVVRRTTGKSAVGADAEAALGARVGGGAEVSRSTSELVDAWTRPAGGAWEQRLDCLGDGTRT